MVEAQEILRILDKYAAVSGQIINLDKSTMTSSPGTPLAETTAIQNLMGIQVVAKLEKYLEMPLVVGRSKKEVFGFMKDMIWDIIKKWNERDFFMAGWEVLIKAVLQAIPNFVMSYFLLPVTLLQDIEKIVRQYWWGEGGGSSMHWLPWSRICQSKEGGGMGFHDLECFNLAMLAKKAWRLLTTPSSLLSLVLKARYFPRATFFQADVGDRPSLTWRSILHA